MGNDEGRIEGGAKTTRSKLKAKPDEATAGVGGLKVKGYGK